jgi:prepilin-type N-terminal cleavage/methylation domain-containing protein
MMRQEQWEVGGGQWAGRSQSSRCAHSPPTAHCQLSTAHSARRGVTLIELLVTMTIIALVSAAILGTASAAMEAGRRSRTQSLVTKINGLIMERFDSYAERRVDVHEQIKLAIDDIYNLAPTPLNAELRGRMLADARMLALRELMKLEMPDSWTDVANRALPTSPSNQSPNQPQILSATPPLSYAYFRQLQAAEANANAASTPEIVTEHQSAECLYLTIMNATGDGEARTLFAADDIGDVDGDGAPEFIDGWGNPIKWNRWPAGFWSHSAVMTGDGLDDHDPFDVFKRDDPSALRPSASSYPPRMQYAINELFTRYAKTGIDPERLLAFRLVPLIFSAGPDGELDAPGYRFPDADIRSLDPYFIYDDEYQAMDVDPDVDSWKDDITNHLNEY